MIKTPFIDPLFWSAFYLLLVGFGLALVLLLVKEHFSLTRLQESVLFERWRSWGIIAPLYLFSVLCGQLTLLLLVLFLVFQGLREYALLVNLPHEYKLFMLTAGLLTLPVALISLDAFYFLLPLFLILGTLEPLLFPREKSGLRNLAFAALGWSYIAWLLAHLLLIYRYAEQGEAILLIIGLATAMSDIGAYIVGRAIGHHKLNPIVSPNKTIEGTLGNLAGAYLGVGLMFFILPANLELPILLALPIGVALGAVWGDLVESAMKREFSVKDVGDWLPGFGGLLDRIDSLILVAPFAFYFLRFIAPLLP